MRCIVVGIGSRGKHWVQICQEMEMVTLVAGVDPVPERREEVKAKFGLKGEQLFSSLEEAVKAVDADFVLDVTPPSVREKIAEIALNNGLPVLAEKAMGEDWAMAKRIAAMVKSSGLAYMVAQNYRFNPLPRTTRRLLDEGLLGTVNTVLVGFHRPWGMGAHYVEMSYGLLIEMAVHHFDTLRYVLNRDAIRVWAHTWNAPWGWHKGDVGHNVVFEFQDGIIVTHHALGCSVGKPDHWQGEWRIDGEKGSLTWESGKLFYGRSFPKELVEEVRLDFFPLVDTKAVLAEFVSALKEKRKPECSAQDNLKTLAMVFGAIESAKRRQWVEIKELFEN
ncbi:MAG: Gfo/Idh/MocA family oxidoreductase [Armatimonadetes bacterium]|nr:Gfo/Idh/MocA family oxidoreductase [Armatimonadota bacterium]